MYIIIHDSAQLIMSLCIVGSELNIFRSFLSRATPSLIIISYIFQPSTDQFSTRSRIQAIIVSSSETVNFKRNSRSASVLRTLFIIVMRVSFSMCGSISLRVYKFLIGAPIQVYSIHCFPKYHWKNEKDRVNPRIGFALPQ
jgi:hypothetical protein